MSLIKRLMMTPEKLAANQSNGRQSQGPATPEGRERIRAANTRHGFYSQAPGAQMQVEDPEEFERLFDSLRTVWEPENEYQTSLVRRMARLTWRLERADRVHEAMLVSQVETLERNIAHELRDAAARHDREVTRLRTLMEALDGNRYHSTELDLEGLERIYGKAPSGVGLEILRRVYRLQSPQSANSGNPGNPADSGNPETAEGGSEGSKAGNKTASEVGSARKQTGAQKQPGAQKQAGQPGNTLTIATGAQRDVLRAELRLLLREGDQAHGRGPRTASQGTGGLTPRLPRLAAGSEASPGGVAGAVGGFRLAAASLYHRPADEAESGQASLRETPRPGKARNIRRSD